MVPVCGGGAFKVEEENGFVTLCTLVEKVIGWESWGNPKLVVYDGGIQSNLSPWRPANEFRKYIPFVGVICKID